MPELPEVETVVRSLAPLVAGRRIAGVQVPDPLLCAPDAPEAVADALAGAVLTDLVRRGKYIVLELAGRPAVALHLRMTGRLLYCPAGDDVPDRCRLELELDGGDRLVFTDVRRLGKIHIKPTPGLETLGPDPFEPGARSSLRTACARRSTAIKNVLLDQRVMAGVGNIYADEALFRAGINPATPAARLLPAEIFRLMDCVREVLAEAIESGGTTFSSYVDGRGVPGEFALRLTVYGRKGLGCRRCGTPVRRMKIGGRGTHYCPECQPPCGNERE